MNSDNEHELEEERAENPQFTALNPQISGTCSTISLQSHLRSVRKHQSQGWLDSQRTCPTPVPGNCPSLLPEEQSCSLDRKGNVGARPGNSSILQKILPLHPSPPPSSTRVGTGLLARGGGVAQECTIAQKHSPEGAG
jgi:hypothetical protein